MISFCVTMGAFWVVGWFGVSFLPLRALVKVIIQENIMIPKMRKKAMKNSVSKVPKSNMTHAH